MENEIVRVPLSWVVPHLCGMAKRLREKRIVMAMRAFFDESGLNPHEDKALVMGGYLGTIEEWERTSEAWDACLSAPPAIRYFKGDEARNLQGEFFRIGRAAADQKANDLADVVGASGLQGFCTSVKHEILAHRDPSATKRMAGSRTYDWAFFTVTSGVLQFVAKHYPDETIDFVLDERRELGQCAAMFGQLKELALKYGIWENATNVFSRGGTCTAADDKKTAALQMADMLCGEFSAMRNGGVPPSEVWKRLVVRREVVHVFCDMPWPIPVLIALQGFGKQIQDASGKILKRIYKDRERTPELSADCDDLIANQALFETAMNSLMEIHQSDERFRRFQEIMRSKDGEDA
jgi:Protein of unknown function (DUF3800)